MARTVYAESPSRLHFGFIDVRDDGMLCGSAGVALDNPTLRFLLSTESSECTGPCAEELAELVRKCMDGECKELMVKVQEFIPRHVGLGSGTQMSLASGGAAAILEDREYSLEDIANDLKRGRRSRIGIGSFSEGGFVIAANGHSKSMDVPAQWRFVVAVPEGQHQVHGSEEKERLDVVRPLNNDEKTRLENARNSMVSALEQEDATLFGEAINEVDTVTGLAFSPAQGGQYSNPLVEKGLEIAQNNGATGGGQSSWGPGFFALAKDEADAQKVSLALFNYLCEQGGGTVFLAGARNQGAIVRAVD